MSNFKDKTIVARAMDIENMLYGEAKSFVPQFEEPGAELTSSPQYPDPTKYLSVYGTVLVREYSVDPETSKLGFLYIDQTNHNVKKHHKLQLDPVGYLVPDITVTDLTTGLNCDCRIEEGVETRVGQAQLTRALVEAANTYSEETLGLRLLDKISNITSCWVYIFQDPTIGVVNSFGQIQLYLICKMSRDELNKLVVDLNKSPVCERGVKFSIVELDQDEYTPNSVAVN